MLANFSIGKKFTLLLSLVFLGGVVISSFVLWQILQNQAQSEITAKGLLLIQTMNSVRDYTSNHINPLLTDDQQKQPTFIAETVPAFSAREVFEQFRQDKGYQDFLYKEATLNPSNLRDKADSFETDLLERMRRDPNMKEESGYRTLAGKPVYFIARPLAVTSPSCLACHDTPETAPKNLVATYGPENGFGWKLNEVVTAQMIYVPAQEILNIALRSFLLVTGIFISVLAVVILLLNYLLRQYVIQPVSVMGGLAHKISTDEMVAADLESEELTLIAGQADELGQLAQVFKRMAGEVYSRTQALKQQVAQLHIEINDIKRQEQVAELTETDFFRDLQTKAKTLRGQHQRKADKETEQDDPPEQEK
jgi:methyl-accepting chemotaxis protein